MDYFTLELERDALRSYKYKAKYGLFNDDDYSDFNHLFMGGEREERRHGRAV